MFEVLSHSFVHLQGLICVDRSEFCEAWKKDGRCERDQWVSRNCMVQCERTDICDLEPIAPTGR